MKKAILLTLVFLVGFCFICHSKEPPELTEQINKFCFGIKGDDFLTPFDKMCFKYWFNQKHGAEIIFEGSIRDSSAWRYYDLNQVFRWIYRFNRTEKQFLYTGLGLVYEKDANYYNKVLNSKSIKMGLNNFIGCEYSITPKMSLLLELALSTTWTSTTGVSTLAAEMAFIPYFGVFVYF